MYRASVTIKTLHYPTDAQIYTVKPRFMNASDHERIFRTQSISDDVLCLEL